MANPYLAYALLIHAGLDGIRRNLSAPLPVNENLYTAPESLTSTLELTGGRLEIDYDIEINHMLAGQSLFRIDVRENTPVKS